MLLNRILLESVTIPVAPALAPPTCGKDPPIFGLKNTLWGVTVEFCTSNMCGTSVSIPPLTALVSSQEYWCKSYFSSKTNWYTSISTSGCIASTSAEWI